MPMRFDKIEIDDDDVKNWDIGYVNKMEDGHFGDQQVYGIVTRLIP
jgi:hypothetical protein